MKTIRELDEDDIKNAIKLALGFKRVQNIDLIIDPGYTGNQLDTQAPSVKARVEIKESR